MVIIGIAAHGIRGTKQARFREIQSRQVLRIRQTADQLLESHPLRGFLPGKTPAKANGRQCHKNKNFDIVHQMTFCFTRDIME
jgi:hypothetical protein